MINLTVNETTNLLNSAMFCGCDRDGDLLTFQGEVKTNPRSLITMKIVVNQNVGQAKMISIVSKRELFPDISPGLTGVLYRYPVQANSIIGGAIVFEKRNKQ